MMIPSCIPLVQSVANSITQAKNMHRFRSLTYLFIAVLNIAGTYVLVHTSGIIGAAVMTGLANIVGQGFLMNWYYWKRVGLNIPRFWKNILNIEEMPLALCILFLILGQFVDFYNETYEKNYHFQLTTAGVRSVMERVREYMDDIGFVYILSQHRENFLHELAKNKIISILLLV